LAKAKKATSLWTVFVGQASKQNLASFFARHIGPIIFVSAFAIFLTTLNGVWATDHTTAFVEFDYAVWAYHSFVLGQVGSFQPGSVDVFVYNGNYFMANAPGSAFIALPFASIGFILTGHFTVWGDVLLLTEVPVALANAAAAYLVFKISSLYFKRHTSAFLAFCYAFSTISWPFATYLYQSDFSAMFDLIAVYFALRIGRAFSASVQDKHVDAGSLALFCGIAVAAGALVDYVNAILIPIFAAYIFFSVKNNQNGVSSRIRERIKLLACFLTESVGLFSFLLGIYNYASFGMVFVSSEQLYLNGASVFTSFTYPVYKGIVLNLFTPMRGLFFFSPILLMGTLGFWRMFRRAGVLREAILFIAVFLGIFIPYSAWYSVTGGLSFGPRFLVAAMPYLLIPTGFAISDSRWKKSSFVIVYLLYAGGVIENGLASMVGVLTPPSSNWLSSPFLSNIAPDIVSGQLDSWWNSYFGPDWIGVAASIVAFALLFPLMCVYFLEKSENELNLSVAQREPAKEARLL
jgi:hypothetical protein